MPVAGWGRTKRGWLLANPSLRSVVREEVERRKALDLALIFELLIDDPKARAAAVLLREEGLRLVGEIAGLIGLEPRNVKTTAAQVEALCGRLCTAGYRLRTDPDMGTFAAKRADHARCIEAIAEHLGTPVAPLLP